MDEIKNFFKTYSVAIIGAIVSIIILCTRLYELMIWIIFIAFGIFIGNYIQNNKIAVKEKLKNFIDRL